MHEIAFSLLRYIINIQYGNDWDAKLAECKQKVLSKEQQPVFMYFALKPLSHKCRKIINLPAYKFIMS